MKNHREGVMSPDQSMLKAPIEVTVGKYCNVHRARYGEPLIRKITAAGWKRRADGLWYEWNWKPEPRVDGRRDCGYSGIRIVNADGTRTFAELD